MSNRSAGASIVAFVLVGLFTFFPRTTTFAVVASGAAINKYVDNIVEAQKGVRIMVGYQTSFCPAPDQIELIIENGSKSYLESISEVYISGYVSGESVPDYHRSYSFYDDITEVIIPGGSFHKCMWLPSEWDRTDRPIASPTEVEWTADVGSSPNLVKDDLDRIHYMSFLTDEQVKTYM